MKTSHLNSRLAAHASIRQLRIGQQADAAGLHAAQAVESVWASLLDLLREDHGYQVNRERALTLFREIPAAIAASLYASFMALYRAGHKMAADASVDVLPRQVVRRLLVGKWDEQEKSRPISVLVAEIRRIGGQYGLSMESTDQQGTGRGTPLVEDAAGLVRLAISTSGNLSTEPAADLSAGEERNILRDVLFPPTPLAQVRSVLAPLVRPFDWMAIGGDAAKKIPEDLASQYAGLVSQGLSQRDIAKEIKPYLDGSRMRAARFARTFGMHVAHEAQLAADDGLGDLLVGYQIREVSDEYSRSWHAARSGTIYYKNPKPGQLGFDRMPRPPLESPDPRDRPAKAGGIAFN